MRHGISAAWVGFALIASVVVFAVKSALVWNAVASLSASEVMHRYTLAIEDKNLQLLKSGFEKTSAFYSLMSTAKELGAHGGLSAKSLEKSDDNRYIKDVNPPLQFEEVCFAGSGIVPCTPPDPLFERVRIPYWVAPSTETSECGATKERIPYLRVTDLGSNIGHFPKGGGRADSIMDIVANEYGKYNQYFNEVNNGDYSLYVSLQVFFMKPGKVMVECGEGCGEIKNLDGTAPAANITSDGIYEYKITQVNMPVFVLNLNLSAIENPADGDGTNVARLKQVVVSIYNATLDASGNKLRMVGVQNKVFTGNLNKFQASMQTALTAAGAGKGSKTTIGPLEGAFYRGYDNTVAGIVWSPDGIVTETDDYLGNDKLLTLRSSGVTEEEAKIRYWTMYDYAGKFARCSDGVLKYWLFKALNTLEDYDVTSKDYCDSNDCGGERGSNYDCSRCKPEVIKSYTRDEIYDVLSSELANLSANYTKQSPSGLVWNITLHEAFFKGGTCSTNPDKGPCSKDYCNVAGDNFESYEYKYSTYFRNGCCGACKYQWGSGVDKNTCVMQYGHRYILKNIRLLVTITDSSNKVFDSVSSAWVPLKFKFFVDIPVVDDNDCDGHKCDALTQEYVKEYPTTLPDLSSSKGCTSGTITSAVSSPSISVSFASPSPGAKYKVGDVVPFKVLFTSTKPVSKVEYYFNTATLAYESPGPFLHSGDSWDWTVDATAPTGTLFVDAVAYDIDSNYAMATTKIEVGAPDKPSLVFDVDDTSLVVGDTTNVRLTAEMFSDQNNAQLKIELPSIIEKISGDDSWTGDLHDGDKKTIELTIKAKNVGTENVTGTIRDTGGSILNVQKKEISVA